MLTVVVLRWIPELAITSYQPGCKSGIENEPEDPTSLVETVMPASVRNSTRASLTGSPVEVTTLPSNEPRLARASRKVFKLGMNRKGAEEHYGTNSSKESQVGVGVRESSLHDGTPARVGRA